MASQVLKLHSFFPSSLPSVLRYRNAPTKEFFDMHYAIMAFDVLGEEARREKWYADHRAHLDKAGDYGVTIVLCGPLTGDDGQVPIGSLFVVEAERRNDVEEFNRQDPFAINGVWERTLVSGFLRRR